ncbi:MAG: porphobilinogen synthase [Deltaproteobacteria bacterium]|nr:porphobilinogen synthase [Deltaproteobacteria bacterium]
MPSPIQRTRRLRSSGILRELVRETDLSPRQLIAPLFIKEGIHEKIPVPSMPGVYQFPVNETIIEAQELWKRGIRSVILFGIPSKKDARATGAYDKNGVVQNTIRAIKTKIPEMAVIGDVCLCSSMDHGHCGVVNKKGEIENDPSLELLAKTALSQAEAGADMAAPSDMMDGRVKAIRQALDENGYAHLPIMSYAVKYASAFYGPFRFATESAPKFGDRKTYQMDIANAREALREAKIDEEEGADIILIKPALPSLDVIARVRGETKLPIAAYQVSGEYAMICAAAEKGWLDRRAIALETLTAIRRAGAQLIVTYFAREIAGEL